MTQDPRPATRSAEPIEDREESRESPASETGAARAPRGRKTARKQPAAKTSAAKTPAAGGSAAKAAPTRKTSSKKPGVKKSASRSAPPSGGDAASPAPEGGDPQTASFTPADYERLSRYLADVAERSSDVIREFAEQNAELMQRGAEPVMDPLDVSSAFADVYARIFSNPYRIAEAQFRLWSEYAKLWEAAAFSGQGAPAAADASGDKRFRHKDWTENKGLDLLKQSYLVFSRWMEGLVADVDGVDEHTLRRAQFFTRQFTDALSPSNFLMTNPDVVQATLDSKGENLIRGLTHFLDDMRRGRGSLAITQTDMEYFKVGENLATAPGKVIFRNEMFELIQYEPTTENVAKRPLLIFPPWINKFYILDLREENSFVRWMVAQGRTVMLVSWVNPTAEMKDVRFEDYMRRGVYAAVDAVEKATGEREMDAIGYCIGGTLLASSLAHMAKTGDDRIKSATFFAAQTEFSDPGDLKLFVDEKQLANIEKQIDAAGGVLEGQAMAATFNMLRANDLIWSFVVNNYLKGDDPKRFDLLFWNADATRMAKAAHLDYLRFFYLENRLAKGELELEGVALNLKDVSIPVFVQASETDHIAPYQSVYRGAKLFGGEAEFMLAGSGHIAGVINHPDARKYHHSVNGSLPASVEEWIAGAEKHPGSWWPRWIDWLNRLDARQVPARTPGDGGLTPIMDAPGSYVREMS